MNKRKSESSACAGLQRLDVPALTANDRGRMAETPNLDPFGLARSWMSQWEKLVNEHGTELLAKPETAQAMQAMSGAAVQLQAASTEASAKLLAAANLPSRTDFEALGARLGAIEAALARIEQSLRAVAPDRTPARPPVARTRKPPAPSGDA